MFEGQGDRVTDESITFLIWNGEEWEKRFALAGKMGWGRTGPDFFGPRARLVRFGK